MITYLEMCDPAEHRRKPSPPTLALREERDWKLNRKLNDLVGRRWQWPIDWTNTRWREYIENPFVRTWVAYLNTERVGYYELWKQDNCEIELFRFGLLPAFIGRGLGGSLLSAAIDEAWHWGATRVWLHTCSFDHPSALLNYLERGFRAFKCQEENR